MHNKSEVGCAVFFKRPGVKAGSFVEVEVRKSQRVTSSGGKWKAPGEGELVLIFDNTFSWTSTKNVDYTISVTKESPHGRIKRMGSDLRISWPNGSTSGLSTPATLAAGIPASPSAPTSPVLLTSFSSVDANGDGVIDKAEWDKAAAKLVDTIVDPLDTKFESQYANTAESAADGTAAATMATGTPNGNGSAPVAALDEVDAGKAAFLAAAKVAKAHPQMLEAQKDQLYALYRQGAIGSCKEKGGERPGMFNFTGKTKWDAWNALGEMSKSEARQKYVAVVRAYASTETNESSA